MLCGAAFTKPKGQTERAHNKVWRLSCVQSEACRGYGYTASIEETHMSEPDNQPENPEPTQQKPKSKLHFANALREAMQRENLTASDVARRVWGTTKDGRGYEVARNRDRIGRYLRGESYPEQENLQRLAEAVGMSVDDLTESPVGEIQAVPRTRHVPGHLLQLTLVTHRPNMMRLQVDRYVGLQHYKQVVELMLLLAEEPPEQEERNGNG